MKVLANGKLLKVTEIKKKIKDSVLNTELCFTEKVIHENRESEANLN